MSNENDIATGPEDEATGITEQQRQNDPEGTAAALKSVKDTPSPEWDRAQQNEYPVDHIDDPFADVPSNASHNPELVPQSQNPNDPSDGDKQTVNIVALIVDNYAFSGPVAYEMCRFGTVKIDDVEWTDKTSFEVPYEQIKGKEIIVFEPGGKGVKFTYGG